MKFDIAVICLESLVSVEYGCTCYRDPCCRNSLKIAFFIVIRLERVAL